MAKTRRQTQQQQQQHQQQQQSRKQAQQSQNESDIKDNCEHWKRTVKCASLRKQQQQIPKCKGCSSTEGNAQEPLSVCFFCGYIGCESHSLAHFEKCTTHSIKFNLTSNSCWCFECDSEISTPDKNEIVRAVKIVTSLMLKPTAKSTKSNRDVSSNSSSASNAMPPSPKINPVAATPSIPVSTSSIIIKPTDSKLHIYGLKNLGNTCFFNSVMQNLANARPLMKYIFGHKSELTYLNSHNLCIPSPYVRDVSNAKPVSTDDDLYSVELNLTESALGPLTLSTCSFFVEMNSDKPANATSSGTNATNAGGRNRGHQNANSNNRNKGNNGGGNINPQMLFNEIATVAPRFKSYEQQDSHEFLRFLLSGLKSEERKRRKGEILNYLNVPVDCKPSDLDDDLRDLIKKLAKFDTLVENVFEVELMNVIKCLQCGKESKSHERNLDVCLSLKSKVSPLAPNKQAQKKNISQAISVSKHQKKKQKKQDRKKKGKNSRANRRNNNRNRQQGPNAKPTVDDEDEDEDEDEDYNDNDNDIDTEETKKPGEQDILESAVRDENVNDDKEDQNLKKEEGKDFQPDNKQKTDDDQDSTRFLKNEEEHNEINKNVKGPGRNDNINANDGDGDGDGDGKIKHTIDSDSLEFKFGNIRISDDHDDGVGGSEMDITKIEETCASTDDNDVKAKEEETSIQAAQNHAEKTDNDTDAPPEFKQIFVRDLDGTLMTFNVEEHQTYNDLKPMINERKKQMRLESTTMNKEESEKHANFVDGTSEINQVDSAATLPIPSTCIERLSPFPTLDIEQEREMSVLQSLVSLFEIEHLTGCNQYICEACTAVEKKRRESEFKDTHDIVENENMTPMDIQADGKEMDVDCQQEPKDIIDNNQQSELNEQESNPSMDEVIDQSGSEDEKSKINDEESNCKQDQDIVDQDNSHRDSPDKDVPDPTGINDKEEKSDVATEEKIVKEKVAVYVDAARQSALTKLPPVLTFLLKRFEHTAHGLKKITDPVDFDLYLDLSPFCSNECIVPTTDFSHTEVPPSSENSKVSSPCLYKLFGVVEHEGGMRGGHYTSYTRMKKNTQFDDKEENDGVRAHERNHDDDVWYYASDTHVSYVSFDKVQKAKASLLFYEYVGKIADCS